MSAYIPIASVSERPEDGHCLLCLPRLAGTLTVMTTSNPKQITHPHVCAIDPLIQGTLVILWQHRQLEWWRNQSCFCQREMNQHEVLLWRQHILPKNHICFSTTTLWVHSLVDYLQFTFNSSFSNSAPPTWSLSKCRERLYIWSLTFGADGRFLWPGRLLHVL